MRGLARYGENVFGTYLLIYIYMLHICVHQHKCNNELRMMAMAVAMMMMHVF